MTDQLITAITDLPVILQGALGSALFALMLYIGQRLSTFVSRQYAQSSKQRRRRLLVEQQIKYNVLHANDFAARNAFVSLLIYRACRSLFKALIWLTLGLIFGFFGFVGYIGCLYYLFQGLNTVTRAEKVDDIGKKLQEIQDELASLGDA